MLNLECDYKLEGDTLYSLKWYRDDKEFYRYIPRGGDILSISICTHTFNFNIRWCNCRTPKTFQFCILVLFRDILLADRYAWYCTWKIWNEWKVCSWLIWPSLCFRVSASNNFRPSWGHCRRFLHSNQVDKHVWDLIFVALSYCICCLLPEFHWQCF